ncbi:MAG: TRAP transporter small permease [Burkholderiaceae bacterium]
MKAHILAFERRLNAVAMVGACLMLAAAACLGMYQVITRFVLEQPAEWSEVLIRFTLIWMVFLGIPTAFRLGAMVSVDVLYRALPRAPRRVLETLIAIAGLFLLAIILWFGIDYAMRGRVQTIIGLEAFSMTWAYAALPVGAVFAMVGVIGNWLDPKREELGTAL